ncbi:MAG: hypothetical protein AAGN82_15765 [Myxococcota bacterium]
MKLRHVMFAALGLLACGDEASRTGDEDEPEATVGATSSGPSTSTGSSGGRGGGGSGATTGSGAGAPGNGIASQYPGDEGIASHPSVIFHSDFESDMEGWDAYTQNTERLDVIDDASLAHGGNKFLRARITRTMLAQQANISAQANKVFSPVDEIYWRFYARFVGNTAPPHHWVRTIALSDSYSAGGHAGFKPGGGDGFWYDFDIRNDDTFSFYTYWHEMRSWMCNDGSTDPGCAGYNGPSNNAYYGNNFHWANQNGFERDAWFCLELHGKANTPGAYDGEVSFYLNGDEIARYRSGSPNGRWLRENFFTHGPYFEDDGPFDGFNFRTDANVGWRQVVLDAYYQRNTLDAKEDNGYPVQETQTILYDDVVVATERIGCKAP